MEIYMRYRYLMATDMDLTLVMPAKDVSEENLRACRALKDNGVALTIA
ncbi:MAG: HAD hydrolase family protein, partial [Clostridiales bacterium]|nr:HAD hydrolase family protein [Clostridiales bacterium]